MQLTFRRIYGQEFMGDKKKLATFIKFDHYFRDFLVIFELLSVGFLSSHTLFFFLSKSLNELKVMCVQLNKPIK